MGRHKKSKINYFIYEEYKITMTPGIDVAKKAKIVYKVHEYSHDSSAESYSSDAVNKLDTQKTRIFKTLIVCLDNKDLVVGVVPVLSKLNMKLIAKAAGGKKATMAVAADVERSTGYVLGGVSPLGQKKRLKTIIDSFAKNFTTIYVSAGRRGLELELTPNDMMKLTNAMFEKICK